AGAIVGCLLSGFVLIGRLGVSETIFAAAVANTAAGLGGLALSRRIAAARGPQLPAGGLRGPKAPLEIPSLGADGGNSRGLHPLEPSESTLGARAALIAFG